ncbi:MAG TPA: retropepsin-like aspartic protease [Bacteroidales bacterium]|nr:retropepsin-like aspartic protease [Bacteroidales bacterium]
MSHLFHKSQNIQIAGPVIEVIIVPPKPVADDLKSKGLKVPAQKTIALIDTGASCTCIDRTIAQALSLVSHDIKNVLTAGGEDMQCLYDAGVILPLAQNAIFPVQVLEAKLEKQPYKVLIGRDILKTCTFIYNGWDNSFTLHL